jgi:hypothetical protein
MWTCGYGAQACLLARTFMPATVRTTRRAGDGRGPTRCESGARVAYIVVD